jgi:hypothetical protein
MIDVLIDLAKSNSNINPAAIALLGQPPAPRKQRQPSPSELDEFLTTNNMISPQDVHAAVKMAS